MAEETAQDCLFCGIVAGRIPATIVHHDRAVTAFRDLNPQAPVHVLVVPNEHVDNTEALEPEYDAAIGAVIRGARDVARQLGVAEDGYRLVLNTGADAGNTVAHLHVHLLGGRRLTWPPG